MIGLLRGYALAQWMKPERVTPEPVNRTGMVSGRSGSQEPAVRGQNQPRKLLLAPAPCRCFPTGLLSPRQKIKRAVSAASAGDSLQRLPASSGPIGSGPWSRAPELGSQTRLPGVCLSRKKAKVMIIHDGNASNKRPWPIASTETLAGGGGWWWVPQMLPLAVAKTTRKRSKQLSEDVELVQAQSPGRVWQLRGAALAQSRTSSPNGPPNLTLVPGPFPSRSRWRRPSWELNRSRQGAAWSALCEGFPGPFWALNQAW